jgi:hypothetical protein
MADKNLMFRTDAGKEVNAVQVLDPRLKQAEALGGKTVTQLADGESELPIRLLARDANGNVVANPILTDMLNTEFINVIRRDWDGKEGDGMFVTFATTSNAENGGIDPEHSLLVSMNDLILNVNVPAEITASVTSEDLTGDPLCKYFGKPILLDASDEQEALWKLVSDRTVRLHKNNGQSVGGKWELDIEAINRRTPNVLHLEASAESEFLSIALDPAVVQTVPVIFTPDDGQDQFKLVLFIKPFDQRPAQKQMKIMNSTSTPAEAVFLRPWVILSTVDDSTLTGAKGEGGTMKCEGLTNCVKAVDAEDGSDVTVTVTVTPKVAAFNINGELDAVKIPSVPREHATSQLKNLVEDGEFVVDAVVTATGYETKDVQLAVCINGEDARDGHMMIVLPSEMVLSAIVANEAIDGALVTTTRHNEDDVLKADALLEAVEAIKRKDGDSEVVLDSVTLVNENGASEAGDPAEAMNPLFVVHGEVEPTGHVLVKCEADGFVTEIIKLPVKITDKRLPDEPARWGLTWSTAAKVEIPATEKGKKGEAIDLEVKELAAGEISLVKDQWGNEEEVEQMVVGIVDARHPLTPDTADMVAIPENAGDSVDDGGTPEDDTDDTTTEGAGCWVNISILTKSGMIINKRILAKVDDKRAAE